MMAYVPFDNPKIDRIINRDYESYVDKLLDEATADNGERCKNCYYFDSGYADGKCYCDREKATEEEIAMDDFSAYEVDPDDCCEHWEWDMVEDEPKEEY